MALSTIVSVSRSLSWTFVDEAAALNSRLGASVVVSRLTCPSRNPFFREYVSSVVILNNSSNNQPSSKLALNQVMILCKINNLTLTHALIGVVPSKSKQTTQFQNTTNLTEVGDQSTSLPFIQTPRK
jgi:hypothetical protein